MSAVNKVAHSSHFAYVWFTWFNLSWFISYHTILLNLPAKHYSLYQPNTLFNSAYSFTILLKIEVLANAGWLHAPSTTLHFE
jgi:hypothetical protein